MKCDVHLQKGRSIGLVHMKSRRQTNEQNLSLSLSIYVQCVGGESHWRGCVVLQMDVLQTAVEGGVCQDNILAGYRPDRNPRSTQRRK